MQTEKDHSTHEAGPQAGGPSQGGGRPEGCEPRRDDDLERSIEELSRLGSQFASKVAEVLEESLSSVKNLVVEKGEMLKHSEAMKKGAQTFKSAYDTLSGKICCATCGKTMEKRFNACPFCGVKQGKRKRKCACCEYELEDDWNFCPVCEKKV